MKVKKFLHDNQFIIDDDKFYYLQSYNSIVARVEKHYNNITLGVDWDYSKTTLKHLYAFLEEYANYYIPYNETNKRRYIQKEINNNNIGYDEELQ